MRNVNKFPCRIRKLKIRMMVITMAVLLALGGCAQKPSFDIESSDEESKDYSEWTYDGSPYITASEKSELVTAHADAAGRIKEIDDAVTLKGIDGDPEGADIKTVRDVTDLKDIANKNGDEEFELKDGHIYFQNLGSDISYEGKGEKELPVSIDVKYYLDDEEVSPDEIKGRKGHVKVEYTLDNTESCEINIGGECRTAYVPFMAVSLVMPKEGSYRNLKLKDCKLSSVNNEDIIMAMTMPGMVKNMEYLDADSDSADFPESFSIELDTDSFEMGLSTTIVTSDLLDESIDLSDITEIKDSLADLKSGAEKLTDAGDDVQEGLRKYEEYLSKYKSGVDEVDKGVRSLNKGIKELDNSKADIYNGARGLSDGVNAFDEGFTEMKKMVDAMAEANPTSPELQGLKSAYDEMSVQLKKLSEYGMEYADGVEKFNEGIGSLKSGSEKLTKGSGTLSSQGDSLLSGYSSLLSGYKQFNKGLDKFYSEGIVKLDSEGRSKINDIENFVRMIEEADNGYKTYSGLEEGQEGKTIFIIETDEI